MCSGDLLGLARPTPRAAGVLPPMTATGASTEDARGAVARRILANTAAPFAANLLGRALSWVLAVVTARTLGPTGTGEYAVAVNLWVYAGILADFGLGTWLNREVARRRGDSDRACGGGHAPAPDAHAYSGTGCPRRGGPQPGHPTLDGRGRA